MAAYLGWSTSVTSKQDKAPSLRLLNSPLCLQPQLITKLLKGWACIQPVAFQPQQTFYLGTQSFCLFAHFVILHNCELSRYNSVCFFQGTVGVLTPREPLFPKAIHTLVALGWGWGFNLVLSFEVTSKVKI